MKDKNKITIAILIVIILGVGVYLGNKNFNSSTVGKISTVEIAPGVTAEIEENTNTSTSSPLYLNPSITKPDFSKPFVVPASYGDSATAIKKQISDIIASLKKDSTSYSDWNDLGIYRKGITDLQGAEEIWSYLVEAAPRATDAYINLGDLYTYYLHNNAKALPLFMKVVEISPHYVEGYRRVVDFYVTALKDKPKALEFLTASIKKYPDMKDSLQPIFDGLK